MTINLKTKNGRKQLDARKKPYFVNIAPGISLGYRAGPGSWCVRAADGNGDNWVRGLEAAADDGDKVANGSDILNFEQAEHRAKLKARGAIEPGALADHNSAPITLDQALKQYADDLAARGAGDHNGVAVRKHLTPGELAREVQTLTTKELRFWRNAVSKRVKATSVNRYCTSLKAALNLAAKLDKRITNRDAWIEGLEALPEDDDAGNNVVIETDEEVRDLVCAAYDLIDDVFGLYVETHVTGARSIQISMLNCGDLLDPDSDTPKLNMPSSLKGKNRTTRTRTKMPISKDLAQKLKAAAAGRDKREPLLLNWNGVRWAGRLDHYRPFEKISKACKLPTRYDEKTGKTWPASIYCLRHTAITRALLARVPTRLVAANFDTSVAMIEKTYSKHIAEHGDDLMRLGLIDTATAAPAMPSNVIPIAA